MMEKGEGSIESRRSLRLCGHCELCRECTIGNNEFMRYMLIYICNNTSSLDTALQRSARKLQLHITADRCRCNTRELCRIYKLHLVSYMQLVSAVNINLH